MPARLADADRRAFALRRPAGKGPKLSGLPGEPDRYRDRLHLDRTGAQSDHRAARLAVRKTVRLIRTSPGSHWRRVRADAAENSDCAAARIRSLSKAGASGPP